MARNLESQLGALMRHHPAWKLTLNALFRFVKRRCTHELSIGHIRAGNLFAAAGSQKGDHRL